MSNESELIKALNSLVTTPDPKIEYRLHYNNMGEIVMCSMTDPHPQSTQYIVVNADEYKLYFRYCVVDGKLKLKDQSSGVRRALLPSSQGFCVVKGNASILIEKTEHYQDIEYYDYKNN